MFSMHALHDMNGLNVMKPNSLDCHPCQSFAHSWKRYRWTLHAACLFFIFRDGGNGDGDDSDDIDNSDGDDVG